MLEGALWDRVLAQRTRPARSRRGQGPPKAPSGGGLVLSQAGHTGSRLEGLRTDPRAPTQLGTACTEARDPRHLCSLSGRLGPAASAKAPRTPGPTLLLATALKSSTQPCGRSRPALRPHGDSARATGTHGTAGWRLAGDRQPRRGTGVRGGRGPARSHTMHRGRRPHATTHGQSITLHHSIKLLVYLFILLLRLGGQGKHLVRLGALTLPVLLVQRLGAGGGRQTRGEWGSPRSAGRARPAPRWRAGTCPPAGGSAPASPPRRARGCRSR